MPQPYKRTVMTIEGERLVSKIMTGNGKIEFVKIVTGNGTYSEQEKEENALREQTELKSQKNIYKINNQEIIESEAETSIRLSAIFSNTDPETGQSVVSEDYYMNEIGVYAREYGTTQEILFSISVTAGDRGDMMLAYVEGQSPIEIHQKYKIAVGSADKVYVKYEPEAYALKNDLDQHKQNTNIHVTNKEILDKLGESDDGQLTYKGTGVGNKITVDDTLSVESENPVQNKVLTEELNKIRTEGEEIKKSVSDGKSEVASSITTMGVATEADATFHTMATNILAIESGIGELPLSITTFTATVQNTVVDLAWTLPTDSLRSGVEIWYKKTNSFGDTPSGTKAYDSNTMLGTTATSCSYDFAESETEFYATIYSYAYINNQRCYTKGKTIQFHTKQVKGFTKILTSGTFTVPDGVTSVDLCLVGGGYKGNGSGNSGTYLTSSVCGGQGGSGGKINEIFNVLVTPNSNHTVTIGSGNNGATLFDSYTSADGTSRASGGIGGIPNYTSSGVYYTGHNGYAGGNGHYAFDDSTLDGIRYGAGGGGGGGTNSEYDYVNGGAGGTNGGGNGATYNTGSRDGNAATANTGSGGGGGTGKNPSGSSSYGGSGGSGICIIRWGY